MAQYQLKKITNKKVWEDFLISRRPQSFLQSWNWGATKQAVGDEIFRLGLFKENELAGICLVIKQRAKRGCYLLVPGGPILNWSDQAMVLFWRNEIEKLARQEKAWFVRVRPEIINKKVNKTILSDLGFIKAPMHVHAENTWVLDLDKDEDTLLGNMRKNTRYSIRKGLKSNLLCQAKSSADNVDNLIKLQKQTAKRYNFVPFSGKLFRKELEKFCADGQAELFTCATKDGQILVAAIIIFYAGCAYYHFSASSSKSRDTYASYLLQWKIIQEAKRRGCYRYNFWGIAPKNAGKNHRFYGVTIFKTGFGGKRIDWLPAQDLPISPLYWLTHSFELLRRKKRSL